MLVLDSLAAAAAEMADPRKAPRLAAAAPGEAPKLLPPAAAAAKRAALPKAPREQQALSSSGGIGTAGVGSSIPKQEPAAAAAAAAAQQRRRPAWSHPAAGCGARSRWQSRSRLRLRLRLARQDRLPGRSGTALRLSPCAGPHCCCRSVMCGSMGWTCLGGTVCCWAGCLLCLGRLWRLLLPRPLHCRCLRGCWSWSRHRRFQGTRRCLCAALHLLLRRTWCATCHQLGLQEQWLAGSRTCRMQCSWSGCSGYGLGSGSAAGDVDEHCRVLAAGCVAWHVELAEGAMAALEHLPEPEGPSLSAAVQSGSRSSSRGSGQGLNIKVPSLQDRLVLQ
ncbi:hypothetical protein COO60DRAFT_606146 [Scenedesmus sp. NREL 46B-D3]|nr:hypothetical protein COO60DRAFT_606146 [Scenedesmus sp. NREL 46B-D3]